MRALGPPKIFLAPTFVFRSFFFSFLNKLVNLINYNLIGNQELDTDEREKKERKKNRAVEL